MDEQVKQENEQVKQETEEPVQTIVQHGQTTMQAPTQQAVQMKYCKHCGKQIHNEAVVCPFCGCQVEEIGGAQNSQPSIVINNANTNSNTNTNNVVVAAGALKKEKNKWVAVLLCFFLGFLGAHKFYEGKVGMGILYLFTLGLFGIGVLVDFIMLLFKPNPYYV